METQEPKTENLPAVVREQENFMMIPSSWQTPVAAAGYRTSYDIKDKDQRRALLLALNNEGDNGKVHIDRVLNLHHITYTPIQFEKNGELVRTIRTILTTHDGENIDFRSEGILKSLGLICTLEGSPPWKDGQVVARLREKKTGKGSMFTLELVDQDTNSGN